MNVDEYETIRQIVLNGFTLKVRESNDIPARQFQGIFMTEARRKLAESIGYMEKLHCIEGGE
jgi:hypothetical protein